MRNLWLSFLHPISGRFRRGRFNRILQQDPQLLQKKILDLGGSLHFWQKVGVDLSHHDITILNVAIDGQSTDLKGGVDASRIVLYDGSTVPWGDKHFDWVISNSVIEHVAPDVRKHFSAEIRRVGVNYLVQTPAFAFPIEPHFVMPFLHWLPRQVARPLAGFGLWGLLRRRTRKDINRYFDEVNILKLKEFRGLFPEADLVVERVAGVPKSYTLVGRAAPSETGLPSVPLRSHDRSMQVTA